MYSPNLLHPGRMTRDGRRSVGVRAIRYAKLYETTYPNLGEGDPQRDAYVA